MTFSRYLFRKGRCIAVFSRRPRLSAVRGMVRAGITDRSICAALGLSPGKVAEIRAGVSAGSIWGEMAAFVAEELRRVAA